MDRSSLDKRNTILAPIAALSFFIPFLAGAKITGAREVRSKSSTTIIQKIKQFSNNKAPLGKAANNRSLSELVPLAPDDQTDQAVLDIYEEIENFYAYDPIAHAWVPIKSFKIISDCRDNKKIDLTACGSLYAAFWACDLANQTWHKVSLVPYLQQANTQINNDSSAMATKKTALSDQKNQLHGVAKDELLEELLGVHTFPQPASPEEQESPWANLSFDINVGGGAIFYENRLENMYLLPKEGHGYFFVTANDQVYKPNWFEDALNKISDVPLTDLAAKVGSGHAVFRGRGCGVPITLGMQYVFAKRLIVAGGREIIFHAINRLVHDDHTIEYTHRMGRTWHTQGRWFAKCGWYAFNSPTHRLFGDIRLSHVRHWEDIFPVTSGTYLYQALAYNLGLGYEQQLTNYLACTTRLSIERQKFKEFSQNEPYNIHYTQLAIYLQIGLAVRCAKSQLFESFQSKNSPSKNYKLNDVDQLEGLQNLLDLD